MKDAWENLVIKYEPLIDRRYNSSTGVYTFFGLVLGQDDYYFGMWRDKDGHVELLSCVGNPEGFGFELQEDP